MSLPLGTPPASSWVSLPWPLLCPDVVTGTPLSTLEGGTSSSLVATNATLMVSPPTCPAVAPLTPRPEEAKGLQRPNKQPPVPAVAAPKPEPWPVTRMPHSPHCRRPQCIGHPTRVNKRTCMCAALAQGSSVQGAQWLFNGLGVQTALTSRGLQGWSPTPPVALPLLISSHLL